jgi:putative membrane protein
MMYGYDFGPQDWLFMLAMMTVMTVLTVVAVVAVVRAVRRDRTDTSAMAVLNERYARGEITSEEYQERKRQLAQQ